ncbi:hypothetical protein PC9H_005943 [Pleurotus ostreatus]|uniref:NAD(P)-binding protein n=2 Tax=Pleurotus ostreatus TaxID=5322 RepID=A0A067N5B0_PLEO1|nr:uncharacterized protein PC9H_005943 [Pleurotus ostreatus]KAF7430241.1 hypothetical protein PC9H_005943 [Pleurotus ostreatus]KDQ22165.1 hypothetical protein PLEOSDRAFT_1059758 [Pleurotus ostreatus PC15]
MSTLGVALITGAGRGLGRAIALRLARDGYDLALNDLHASQGLVESLAAEVKNRGRKCTIVPADVKSEAEVQGMIKRTVKDLGSLDVMIANAGIVLMKPLLEVEAEDWDEVQAVNGRGTFLCYKYAAKQMVDQGRGGRIIGASSLAGKQGWSHLSAYSSSKFTIRGLTQAAAVELAKHDITVNAYSPGMIDTRMKQILGDASGDPEGFFKGYTDHVPLRRFGTSDEVAGLVSYLVSKEASYITGQSISINGGIYCD